MSKTLETLLDALEADLGCDPENPPVKGAVGLVIQALEKTRCDCGHQGVVLCDRCACLRLLRGDSEVVVPDVQAAVKVLRVIRKWLAFKQGALDASVLDMMGEQARAVDDKCKKALRALTGGTDEG